MRLFGFIVVTQLVLAACDYKLIESTGEPNRSLDEPPVNAVIEEVSLVGEKSIISEPEKPNTIVIERKLAFPRRVGGSANSHGLFKLCGNKNIDGKETCDDGNSQDNDGCSRKCLIEEGFPTCQWLCESPKCDSLVCNPICEPPRCQTNCEELVQPQNCSCETKCEKPECEIRCPDECKENSCPTCTTTCKPVHCVVHCQKIDPMGPNCESPTPNCRASCGTAPCECKCTYPDCSPNCQLKCDDMPLKK